HGPNHALRVKTFATQLSYIVDVTPVERHLLRAAALFHDIGNVVDRAQHNVISQQTVEQLCAAGKLPFTKQEGEIIALLCRWHRREYDPSRTDTLRGELVRTGLLAAVLRVADAMDIDHRRSDYSGRFKEVLEFFFPANLPHWKSLEQILGVRIIAGQPVALQVFTRGLPTGNIQIDMLRGDLGSTPFDWTVMASEVTALAPERAGAGATPVGRALLVLPFEAHSLVVGALSRKHLREAGYEVDLLCYPDTDNAPSWLCREVLPGINAADYTQIVMLGDRPDDAVTSDLLSLVGQWRQNDVRVSILNRHEGNWSRLPRLVALGAEVVLGGDWAYFWGQGASEADLNWTRIAALCTRDPTQSCIGVTPQERAVTEGLLSVMHETLCEPPADSTLAWLAVAEPILDRIAADDQDYFARRAGRFRETCETEARCGRIEGQLVVFDKPPGTVPQAYYWVLETAIEAAGRVPDRGLRYNAPYALAWWPAQDSVELLAISHWREEHAIPVRLLCPAQAGPQPQGDECTVRIHMSAEQATAVIPAILAAVDQSQD
ncbi:MAG: HD domain-containing protein, partial [Bacteroidota bacterium]